MANQLEVIGLGNSAVDYLGVVPHFPEQDEKMRLLEFTKQRGRPVATALVKAPAEGKPRYNPMGKAKAKQPKKSDGCILALKFL